MDGFEFNKMAGAVLATGLGVMALSIVSEMIYQPIPAKQPGYAVVLAPAEGEVTTAGAGGGAPTTPIAVRLQTASVSAGETVSKKCAACHTFMKGQQNKVGPNLWDVVDAPVIHHPDFKYSQAMREKGAQGMTWTFENLDQFLTAPKKYIPGTAMSFAGLPNPTDRANVIAYLRTLSDNPVPLPSASVSAEPTTGGAAPEHSTPLPPPATDTPATPPAQ